jgi:hypothetical protein
LFSIDGNQGFIVFCRRVLTGQDEEIHTPHVVPMQIGNHVRYLTTVNWERMSVNGEVRKISQTPAAIAACCSWWNIKRFDFVAVGDELGSIIICEAFSFERQAPVAFCRGAIVDLAFMSDAVALAVVTEEGDYLRIPLAPDISSNCEMF